MTEWGEFLVGDPRGFGGFEIELFIKTGSKGWLSILTTDPAGNIIATDLMLDDSGLFPDPKALLRELIRRKKLHMPTVHLTRAED